jgi:predicted secreted protein
MWPECGRRASLTSLWSLVVCPFSLVAAKYYSSFEHEEKRQLEIEVHKLVTKRDPKFTNFIEVRCPRSTLGHRQRRTVVPVRDRSNLTPCTFSLCLCRSVC